MHSTLVKGVETWTITANNTSKSSGLVLDSTLLKEVETWTGTVHSTLLKGVETGTVHSALLNGVVKTWTGTMNLLIGVET